MTEQVSGRPELTDPQARLLEFVRSYVKQHGYPPSVRECMPVGPWQSTSSVTHQLNALVGKGYLVRGDGARTLTIVDTEE